MSSATGWRLKKMRGTSAFRALSMSTAAAVRSTMLTHSASHPRPMRLSTCSSWVVWFERPSTTERLMRIPLSCSSSRAIRSSSAAMVAMKVSSWV